MTTSNDTAIDPKTTAIDDKKEDAFGLHAFPGSFPSSASW